MKLYLVQHGEAKPRSADLKRPLTGRGAAGVTRVAALARQAGIEIGQIMHNDLKRAVETASILADYLEPVYGVTTMTGLGPQDDVRLVTRMLEHAMEPLMLAGHRPFPKRLAGLLLTGDERRPVVSFRKGGLVCLTRSEVPAWAVEWIITPDLAP